MSRIRSSSQQQRTTSAEVNIHRQREREPSPAESYLNMAESSTTADTVTAAPVRAASVPAPTHAPATLVANPASDPWAAAERAQQLMQQQQHVRDDSGTYSTLSSSALGSMGAPPMHTIGPKRGADLIKSRPKILAPSPRHARSTPNVLSASVDRPMPDFNGHMRKPSGLSQELPGTDHDPINEDFDYGGYDESTADEAPAPGHRKTSSNHAAARQNFYQLSGREGGTQDSPDRSGHVLSSEALAMHDALLKGELAGLDPRIVHAVNTGVIPPLDDLANDFIRRTNKVSTGTLGSPFDVVAAEASGVKQAKAARTNEEPPRQGNHGNTKHAKPTEEVSFLRKQAFPSVGEHEQAKATAEPTTAATRKVSKKAPPVSGLNNTDQERQRTASGVSADGAYRKDTLLEQLAAAVKRERRLRSDYEHELKLANDELEKIFVAEAARDVEMARLQARHTRDKHLISELKLKLEMQAVELARAAEVDAHDAEAYLDLLKDDSLGLSRAKRRTTEAARVDADDTDSESDNARPAAVKGQEKSMGELLAEQDAAADYETADWTRRVISENRDRRERFKAKQKLERAREKAASPGRREAIDASRDDSKLAKAVEGRPTPPKLVNPAVSPPAGRTRKMSDSLKDSVRRLVGLPTIAVARQASYERKAQALLDKGPPLSPLPAPPMSLEDFDARVRAVAKEIEDNPLSPIPTDPKASKKASKSNRVATLAPPTVDVGTWGRSSSMDVPRPQQSEQSTELGLGSSRASGLVVPRSGYSSDSDVPSGDAGFFTNATSPSVRRPRGAPPVSGARFGALPNGGGLRSKFSFKRRSSKSGSEQDSDTAASQPNDIRPKSNSKAGSGFFKHLFPNLAESSEADGDLTTSSQGMRFALLGSNVPYKRGRRPSVGVQGYEARQASEMETERRRASGGASSNGLPSAEPSLLQFPIHDARTWSQQLPSETVHLPAANPQSTWS